MDETAVDEVLEGLAFPQEAEIPWKPFATACCGVWPKPGALIISLYRSILDVEVCPHHLYFAVCWGHVPGGGVGWEVDLSSGYIQESYQLERLKRI